MPGQILIADDHDFVRRDHPRSEGSTSVRRQLMRILIVDDNDRVRRGVADLLAATPGWEVCGEACNGAEGVQKSKELVPDVILLDISMPGLGGLEVARLLRKEVPSAKILIMSQNDAPRLLPSVLEAGAHGCIDKSRLSIDLISSIEKLHGGYPPPPSR